MSTPGRHAGDSNVIITMHTAIHQDHSPQSGLGMTHHVTIIMIVIELQRSMCPCSARESANYNRNDLFTVIKQTYHFLGDSLAMMIR